MPFIKSLWVLVQKDPHFMRRLNGWLTVFWVAMIPVSVLMGWLASVAYVSALSLWALVSGHWAAWQAARVEVNQENGKGSNGKGPSHRETKKRAKPATGRSRKRSG
jgi:hypothetical protein